MAFEANIVHPSKHVPWGGAAGGSETTWLGVNWSAAAFQWTARDLPGDTGTARISLANAAAGSQGVSATYDAAYVHPYTGMVVGATTILPQIDEATFEALTWGSVASAPLVLHYDLLVTPSGGPQRVIRYGTFTLNPGVGD